MKRLAIAAALMCGATICLSTAAGAQPKPPTAPATANVPLAEKIGHYEPAKTRLISGVHEGAGTMNFGPLLVANALSTNLIFIHRGVIHPHSSIGEHFHNHCEEMFVIFDDTAQFTINGRTSQLTGTWGAPDRIGSAHAVYNPTDHDIEWLNINVGLSKVYDNFDLQDDRVGAPLDKIPQFVTLHMDKSLLKPVDGEPGVSRRRALGPAVFFTPWSYVDHLLIQPGAATTATTTPDMSDAYYVISGDGTVTVNGETAPVKKGDAIPVDLGQTKSFKAGSAPLELMVIGVARDMKTKEAFMADPANAH